MIERDWSLYYNLPSKRRKIRRIKTGQDKALLKLDRERKRILDTIRQIGL